MIAVLRKVNVKIKQKPIALKISLKHSSCSVLRKNILKILQAAGLHLLKKRPRHNCFPLKCHSKTRSIFNTTEDYLYITGFRKCVNQ